MGVDITVNRGVKKGLIMGRPIFKAKKTTSQFKRIIALDIQGLNLQKKKINLLSRINKCLGHLHKLYNIDILITINCSGDLVSLSASNMF